MRVVIKNIEYQYLDVSVKESAPESDLLVQSMIVGYYLYLGSQKIGSAIKLPYRDNLSYHDIVSEIMKALKENEIPGETGNSFVKE